MLNMKSIEDIFPTGTTNTEKMNLLVDAGFLEKILTAKQKNAEFLFNTQVGRWYLSNQDTNLLYHSNFDNDNGITSLKAGWSISDGSLTHTSNDESRSIFNGSNGSDYSICLTGTYVSGANNRSGYGIYYRATKEENISGYCFQFDPGAGNQFTVRTVENGKEQDAFKNVSMDIMGSDFSITDPHDIKIVVKDDQHIISVDDKEILNFNDTTFQEGYVGVRTWSGTKVKLDEVTITKN